MRIKFVFFQFFCFVFAIHAQSLSGERLIAAFKTEIENGRAESVLPYIEKTIENNEIVNDSLSFDDYTYMNAINLLCCIWLDNSQYSKVDSILNRADSFLYENNLRTDYGYLLSIPRGLMYYSLSNIEKAKEFLTNARIEMEMKSIRDKDYADCLGSLSSCYFADSDVVKTKIYLDEAISIYDRYLGGKELYETKFGAILMSQYAVVDITSGRYQDAIDKYTRMLNYFFSKNEKNIPGLSMMVNNLSYAYEQENHLDSALLWLRKLDLDKINDREKLYYYSDAYLYSLLADRQEESIQYASCFSQFLKHQITEIVSTYGSQENEYYVFDALRNLLVLNSLAYKYPCEETFDLIYKNNLFSKKIQFLIGTELKIMAENSNDPQIRKDYAKYVLLSDKAIYGSYSYNDSESLRDSMLEIEKSLLKRIPNYKLELKEQIAALEDKKDFGSNAAAIEFVVFPEILSINRTNNHYGAIILNSSADSPKFIDLCNLDSLNTIVGTENHPDPLSISNLYSSECLYDMVWAPLEPYLSGKERIYLSLCGVLNKLNFDAIKNPEGAYLSDKYEIHRFLSTADIQNGNDKTFNSAALYGDISFSVEDKTLLAESSKYHDLSEGSDFLMRSFGDDRGSFSELPGTREEVELVDSILKGKTLNTKLFLKCNANEESFKAMSGNSPEILHIATHGFYLADEAEVKSNMFAQKLLGSTEEEHLLLRTGLLFAGANRVWSEHDNLEGVQDGILTSDEISKLDLRNTKLVVLSACETALGDISNINGVTGLQLGFKKAGVGTIVMSLWKVPDEATSKLMEFFYRNLMNGMGVHQSLKLAQKEMISIGYDDPYYWAAFVILD